MTCWTLGLTAMPFKNPTMAINNRVEIEDAHGIAPTFIPPSHGHVCDSHRVISGEHTAPQSQLKAKPFDSSNDNTAIEC